MKVLLLAADRSATHERVPPPTTMAASHHSAEQGRCMSNTTDPVPVCFGSSSGPQFSREWLMLALLTTATCDCALAVLQQHPVVSRLCKLPQPRCRTVQPGSWVSISVIIM